MGKPEVDVPLLSEVFKHDLVVVVVVSVDRVKEVPAIQITAEHKLFLPENWLKEVRCNFHLPNFLGVAMWDF